MHKSRPTILFSFRDSPTIHDLSPGSIHDQIATNVCVQRLPRAVHWNEGFGIVVIDKRNKMSQYRARPPDMSKTAPVLNRLASVHSHATRCATSSPAPLQRN